MENTFDNVNEVTRRRQRNKLIIILIYLISLIGVGVYYFVPMSATSASNYEYVYMIDDYSNPNQTVNIAFLSFGIDSSFIYKEMPKYDEAKWKILTEYAKILSPAYFRFGGTSADEMIFNETLQEENQYIITYKDVLRLHEFCHNANIHLIFDLNALLRKGKQWDPSNARNFLTTTRFFNKSFQLGNEPNSYRHQFNITILPEQLARDYVKLRRLMDESDVGDNSLIIGPEVTNPRASLQYEYDSWKYLKQFLPLGIKSVDVVSWHHYYFDGRTATLENFLDPHEFDTLIHDINIILSVVRMHSESVPVWITETGSAYGGGARGLSDRYASTFQWIDKLGVAAQQGIDVIIRHAFVQGSYALIDEEFQPTPEFWLSVFYKKLVGRNVYYVLGVEDKEDPYVRLYVHSAVKGLRCQLNRYTNASMVLFGLNLNDHEVDPTIVGKRALTVCAKYVFTSDDLLSKKVKVNGIELFWNGPDFDISNYYDYSPTDSVMPPYSIAFWTLAEP